LITFLFCDRIKTRDLKIADLSALHTRVANEQLIGVKSGMQFFSDHILIVIFSHVHQLTGFKPRWVCFVERLNNSFIWKYLLSRPVYLDKNVLDFGHWQCVSKGRPARKMFWFIVYQITLMSEYKVHVPFIVYPNKIPDLINL